MQTKIKAVVKGLLTFIPGVERIIPKKRSAGGGTSVASYCYNVWIKHITMLWENGLRSMPTTLAEVGPGDSLGIGLASVLSGVNNYYALDAVKHSNTDLNLKIFEELTELFKNRAPRSSRGWPNYDGYLDKNLFPSHILTDEVLRKSLSDERISFIRNAILNPESQNNGITIKYAVPWMDESIIDEETVDVILSHSVLEHVADLEASYRAFYKWLKPNGVMSHQIDFQSHHLSKEWNGYRSYSEPLWKIIMGKRPFLINREPFSVHINHLKNNSFKITCQLQNYQPNGIKRSQLSSYWEDISEDDLACSGAFIQSQKQ